MRVRVSYIFAREFESLIRNGVLSGEVLTIGVAFAHCAPQSKFFNSR